MLVGAPALRPEATRHKYCLSGRNNGMRLLVLALITLLHQCSRTVTIRTICETCEKLT